MLPSLARNPRELAIANSLRQGFGNAGYCVGALAGGAAAASAVGGGRLRAGARRLGGGAVRAHRGCRPIRGPPTAPRAPARASPASCCSARARCARPPRCATPPALLATIAFVYGILDVLIVVVAIELVELGAGGVGVLNSAWGAGGWSAASRRWRCSRAGASAPRWTPARPASRCRSPCSPPRPTRPSRSSPSRCSAWAGRSPRRRARRSCSGWPPTRAWRASSASPRPARSSPSRSARWRRRCSSPRSASAGRCSRPRSSCRCSSSRAGARRSGWTPRPSCPSASCRRCARSTCSPRCRWPPSRRSRCMRCRGSSSPTSRSCSPATSARASTSSPTARWRCRPDRSCARLGPGDYFGEIALLRDEPRMASVVAATDGLLYVVARQPFLQAVTGQARAAQAAEAVVDARLREANRVHLETRSRGARLVEHEQVRRDEVAVGGLALVGQVPPAGDRSTAQLRAAQAAPPGSARSRSCAWRSRT